MGGRVVGCVSVEYDSLGRASLFQRWVGGGPFPTGVASARPPAPMGLHESVKKELRTRAPFKNAFKEFASLVDARDATRATREQTVACIDGNVVFRHIPRAVNTFDSYFHIVHNNLKNAVATSGVTVVVFDEPEVTTEAKRQEQAARDARSKSKNVACSADVEAMLAVPTDDNYTKADLLTVRDFEALVRHRPSRMRFFDELAVRVMERLKDQIERWNRSGHFGGHVVFDGVDARGADRPKGEPRTRGVMASSEALAELFVREGDVGEGDLKLAIVGRRVRELARGATADSPLKHAKLTLCTTTDTDSFAIELIEEARRGAEPVTPANTLLCMRERAKTAKRAREDGQDVTGQGYYTVCDVAMLHALLQRHMWGMNRSPTPVDQRAAISLLAAGFGLARCDFVELKPLQAKVVLDSIGEIVKMHTDVVGEMRHAWEGDRAAVERTHAPIRLLMAACASKLMEMPRIHKDRVIDVRQPDEVALKKIGWVMAYWNGVEHLDVAEFGFVDPTAQVDDGGAGPSSAPAHSLG